MKAEKHPTGVRIERHLTCDLYVGDKESLLAHPSCPDGIFDGEGLVWKLSHTIKLSAGGKVSVRRSGGRYELRIDVAKTECEARSALQAQAEQKQRELEFARRELELAKWRTDGLARSSDTYRSEALSSLTSFGGMVRCIGDGTFGTVRGGYLLDADARNTIDLHLQAIRSAFETGRIVFDAAALAKVEAEIMATVRTADPAFSKLLSQIGAGSEGGAS